MALELKNRFAVFKIPNTTRGIRGHWRSDRQVKTKFNKAQNDQQESEK